MKLEIERSGGFAGLTKKITVDTEDLPREMAIKIEKHMVRKSFKRPSLPMKKRVADSFFYKISGHFGKEKQELEFNEFDGDHELKSFLLITYSKIIERISNTIYEFGEIRK